MIIIKSIGQQARKRLQQRGKSLNNCLLIASYWDVGQELFVHRHRALFKKSLSSSKQWNLHVEQPRTFAGQRICKGSNYFLLRMNGWNNVCISGEMRLHPDGAVKVFTYAKSLPSNEFLCWLTVEFGCVYMQCRVPILCRCSSNARSCEPKRHACIFYRRKDVEWLCSTVLS